MIRVIVEGKCLVFEYELRTIGRYGLLLFCYIFKTSEIE